MEKQNNYKKINGEILISPEFERMMDFFIHMEAIILDFKEMLQLEDEITEIVVHRFNNEKETNSWRERSIWN
jgi:hypothetical protein